MDYQNNYNQQNTGIYDWDSEIQQESSFVLLPAGDYHFTIEKFDRARYNGGEKIPPCPKAIVTFRVYAPDGRSTLISENYYLWQGMEWKLSEFFAAIGLKKKGEPVRMMWTPELIGKGGVCKVYVDKFNGKDGSEKESNKIRSLYPAWEQPRVAPAGDMPPYAAQAAANGTMPQNAPAQQQYSQTAGTWTQGQF